MSTFPNTKVLHNRLSKHRNDATTSTLHCSCDKKHVSFILFLSKVFMRLRIPLLTFYFVSSPILFLALNTTIYCILTPTAFFHLGKRPSFVASITRHEFGFVLTALASFFLTNQTICFVRLPCHLSTQPGAVVFCVTFFASNRQLYHFPIFGISFAMNFLARKISTRLSCSVV